MNSGHLNEHDANQGAQSRGEFFGMTGNSAWYLFGSAGASLLLVIVLWGMLGLSLLLCLFLGLVLCGLSVAYVFGLKNNRPAHYDTDFFESALIEAGVIPLAFGPREKRPPNPFSQTAAALQHERERRMPRGTLRVSRSAPGSTNRNPARPVVADAVEPRRPTSDPAKRREKDVRVVPLAAFERLQSEFDATTELLEDALVEREEGVCG